MMKNVNQEGSLCLEKKYREIKGKKNFAGNFYFRFFSGHFLLFMKEGIANSLGPVLRNPQIHKK